MCEKGLRRLLSLSTSCAFGFRRVLQKTSESLSTAWVHTAYFAMDEPKARIFPRGREEADKKNAAHRYLSIALMTKLNHWANKQTTPERNGEGGLRILCRSRVARFRF